MHVNLSEVSSKFHIVNMSVINLYTAFKTLYTVFSSKMLLTLSRPKYMKIMEIIINFVQIG
jgi:hypothetical protein